MPRVTRRTLLIGGGVAAALPTGWLAMHATTSRVSIISGYLRGQLPGLMVSDTNLDQFSDEYLQRNVNGRGRKAYHHAIFLMLANPTLADTAPRAVRSAFDKFSRALMTKFLRSTDLFSSAEQRLDKTDYVSFADPYEVGCSNPLARFEQEV